jgi:hypothetical protein
LLDADLRRLALDHLLLDALDRRRRVEDADLPLHQPVEETADRRQMQILLRGRPAQVVAKVIPDHARRDRRQLDPLVFDPG